MIERPLSEKAIKQAKEILEKRNSLPSTGQIKALTDKLFIDIEFYTKNKPKEEQLKRHRSWKTSLSELTKHYDGVSKALLDYIGEEELIKRVETDGAKRNLYFRVGTTAAIALTMAIAYSIAANCSWIYLPFVSKTVIHQYKKIETELAPDPKKYKLTKTTTLVDKGIKGKRLAIRPPKL